MTVIRPNSVSGINSITAQADEIKVFKSNGTQGGLIIGGANLNATTGISTILALNVTGNVSIAGTLTYQDVTNVDSLGIGTFRTGINVSGGQLDVGSNIKIGNAGVITATTFSGDGSNLTGIAADKIFEGNTKAEVIDTGSNGKFIVETEGVQRLEVNTEGKLLIDRTHASATTGNHPALEVDTYANGTAGATFATGIDFNIAGVHKKRLVVTNADSSAGTGDWIFYRDNGNNEALRITSSGNLGLGTVTDDQRLRVYNGIGVNGYKTALFDSNSTHGTRLVITNSNNTSGRGLGIMVGGQYAGTDRASFGWFNSDNTYASASTHSLMTIQSDGKIGIGRNDPVNFVDIVRGSDEENILLVRGADTTTEYGAMGVHSGNMVITGGGAGSTNTGIMFRTAASGNETNRLLITSAGNVEPATDNTYNFGSLTKRWANLYTADLNLSNEGSKNDVDGTWGQYTIQEGEDDLYLINKRSGKKYKFLLQEVS